MLLMEVSQMIPLVVLLVVIVASAVLAPKFGADTRPNADECGCWI